MDCGTVVLWYCMTVWLCDCGLWYCMAALYVLCTVVLWYCGTVVLCYCTVYCGTVVLWYCGTDMLVGPARDVRHLGSACRQVV